MCASRRLDQLRRNAHPSAGPPHRAFQNIAHAQLAPDLLHVNSITLVRKTRITGDYEEPANAADGSSDLLDHAVGEILLLRVAAHVGEGQHCDRRLVGEGQGWSRKDPGRRRTGCDPVGSYPPRNVLERLIADVFKDKVKLA